MDAIFWLTAACLGLFALASPVARAESSTGRLVAPVEFEIEIDGRIAGAVKLPPETPVRVIAKDSGRVKMKSASGTAWAPESSVRITGEELAFEKRELLDAMAGLGEFQSVPPPMPGRRARNLPAVPGLPTGKENIPSDAPDAEKAVLSRVNTERRKAGLPSLTWDADLARAARFHAAHMATHRYFDHDTLLPGKGKVLECFQRIGKFSQFACAENIAWGQHNAEDVMRSWLASTGHRENILSKRATAVGIGCVGGYWVQDFGRAGHK